MNDASQEIAEYAILLACLLLVALSAVGGLGNSAGKSLHHVHNKIKEAHGHGNGSGK